MRVQAFIPQLPVETLHVRVLYWTSRFDMHQLDLPFDASRQKMENAVDVNSGPLSQRIASGAPPPASPAPASPAWSAPPNPQDGSCEIRIQFVSSSAYLIGLESIRDFWVPIRVPRGYI